MPGRPQDCSDATLEYKTDLGQFIKYCTALSGIEFSSYTEFERFSIEHYKDFWRYFLDWSRIDYIGDPSVVTTSDACEHALFFPNLQINAIDHLLSVKGPQDAARPAITSCDPERSAIRLTRGALRRTVSRLGAALQDHGIGPGSRVAMVAQNDSQAAVAVFGAMAIGAVVSISSTDLAADAAIVRFAASEPVLLFCHLFSPYPSVAADLRQRIGDIVQALPSLKLIIALDDGDAPAGLGIPLIRMDALTRPDAAELSAWPKLPFNHPQSILFTSGTTGQPKSMLHSAGGLLLEHLKCHRLHSDITPRDKVFFQASPAWVIWRIMLSALGTGAEIVLNSGPVSSPDSLWRIVADERVTIFGTSPAYLTLCEKNNFIPRDHFDFSALRSLVSMGAILQEQQQAWVWSCVKPLIVRSNYGSTEINGSLLLPSPALPDHPGQLQARSLGIDVRALHQGECSLPFPIGELIVANPFPSRPLGFLDDPDGQRFHDAYFAQNPGVWTQGDLVEFTPEGGARLHGRLDGIINIRGVRIGPSEIYAIVLQIDGITGALAVAQDRPEALGGERLVLLVTLAPGLQLEETLTRHIRAELKQRASSMHMPDLILEVPELPTTHNGKLSERSASDALNIRPISNLGALRNPDCLQAISAHPALQEPTSRAIPTSVGPSDSVETTVQMIWQRVFERDQIGLDENFFDLGGDSLIAIQVLVALEKTLKIDLPITILYQSPTIAMLADAIERSIRPKPSLLVTLKGGSKASGAVPLFLVHGIGGNIMELRPLAQSIDYPGAVIGIQPRGIEGESEPLDRIEAMASCYVEAIRSVQPDGPYLLAGYSLGGIVALEMARILLARGEPVRPLIMIDAPLDEREWPTRIWLGILWHRLRIHAASLLDLTPRAWPGYLSGVFNSLMGHYFRRFDRNPARHFANFYKKDLPSALARLLDSGIAAATAYKPRFLDHTSFFLKAEHGIYTECDPEVIWKSYLRDMQVEIIPGDHDTILAPPQLARLSSAMTTYLRRHDSVRLHSIDTVTVSTLHRA
jgi:acetoacetyl-CoA synthetase